MERQQQWKKCVNNNDINNNINVNPESKPDKYLKEIGKRKYWYFVGSGYNDTELRLNVGLAWLGGMFVDHSPACNSSEVLIAFNTVDEMLSTVRAIPDYNNLYGIRDLPKLADSPMRTGFVKTDLMKTKLITGPEPDRGWHMVIYQVMVNYV